MSQNKLFEDLCVKDPRYPDHAALFPADEYEPGDLVPRVKCYCDNCYRGKDRLAVIAIELLEALETCEAALSDIFKDCGTLGNRTSVKAARAAIKKARGE